MSMFSAPSVFPAFCFSFLFLFMSSSWGCHPEDRAALLAFSSALHSPVWSPTNVSRTDCCQWIGVQCSPVSSSPRSIWRVVGLELRNMTLSGPVSGSLGRLAHLKWLDLSRNGLFGRIPEDLFRIHSLAVIDLSYNSLSGPLNSAVGNLSGLIFLNVAVNNLFGNIPDVFRGLKRLQCLDVSDNHFSGSLPVSLSFCSDLGFVDASRNNFSGPLGINFTGLSSLECLVLNGNYLTGHIPKTISSATNLKYLDLGENEFYGQIPLEFKFLQSLRVVNLALNKFYNITRALTSLQQCEKLTILDISGNFVSEKMPGDDEVTGFPSLKALSILNSGLSGTVPVWLSRSDMLASLYLRGNHLTGQVPIFLTQLKSLNGSNDQNDHFKLPVIVKTRFINVVVPFYIIPAIDISRNLLFGDSWMKIGQLRELVKLDLSHNFLTGSIPDDFSKMKNLEVLDLSSNQISGTIPYSLKQLTYLSFFCVANNRLHGDVPTGFQFSTFPSSCFDGNSGLCYVGKSGCYSTPFSIKPKEKYEEAHNVVDMGIPFAIGVTVGYAITFIFCMIHYYLTMRKR